MVTWATRGITPHSRAAGMPEVVELGEATSQTQTLGAPLNINASGVLQENATTGTVIYGFSTKAGQNVATDGAKQAAVYRIVPGTKFEGTLSVTSWADSFIGSEVALQKTSSTWILATLTSISSLSVARILGPATSQVTAGDSMPPVIFTVLNTKTEGVI